MNYTILVERHAQKSLAKLPKPTQFKIIEAIENLAITPRPQGVKKLVGRDAWRIRIGSYRVIYEIQNDKLVILVVAIGDRKAIYKIKR